MKRKLIPGVGYAKERPALTKIQETLALPKPPTGFIYFIMSPDCEALKVGYASDVNARLANLSTAHYDDLELYALFLGNKEDEALLHALLKKHHIKREWFRFSDELGEFIDDLLDAEWLLEFSEAYGGPPYSIRACLELRDRGAREKLDELLDSAL